MCRAQSRPLRTADGAPSVDTVNDVKKPGAMRDVLGPVLVAVLFVSASACTSDASSKCDAMRAELQRLAPAADTSSVPSWNDILVLNESTTKALLLRDEIEAHCG